MRRRDWAATVLIAILTISASYLHIHKAIAIALAAGAVACLVVVAYDVGHERGRKNSAQPLSKQRVGSEGQSFSVVSTMGYIECTGFDRKSDRYTCHGRFAFYLTNISDSPLRAVKGAVAIRIRNETIDRPGVISAWPLESEEYPPRVNPGEIRPLCFTPDFSLPREVADSQIPVDCEVTVTNHLGRSVSANYSNVWVQVTMDAQKAAE